MIQFEHNVHHDLCTQDLSNVTGSILRNMYETSAKLRTVTQMFYANLRRDNVIGYG